MKDQTNLTNRGVVVAVRGSVVDIRFEEHLPPIYSVLRAGEEGRIVIEVMAQRDARWVRGIALTPTQGLARGMAVEDTGGPLEPPVGKEVVSCMFDVFGNAIDRGAALSDVQWRSVLRAPPPLARRSTKSDIFETGIKGIDVLVLLERGGEAGLFGGAGVGKAQRAAYRVVGGDLKLAYAQFEELETFARFGARLDEDTRKIIEHGRGIHACLRQPEFAPVSVPAQIAVLLALTAGLFDRVPLDQMTDAEQTVIEASTSTPTEVCARLETADMLSDEDRETIFEIARKALSGFSPAPGPILACDVTESHNRR